MYSIKGELLLSTWKQCTVCGVEHLFAQQNCITSMIPFPSVEGGCGLGTRLVVVASGTRITIMIMIMAIKSWSRAYSSKYMYLHFQVVYTQHPLK